jgi:Uncharacterized protein involved in exopolysaccharide biosynthesis
MPLENKAGAEQPQRANAAYAISEDEISLRDLWEIIAKRKWLVFLSTVVCLGLAAAYVSLATTIYESRAMVQIGKVAGQPVDNGLQLASRLMNQYTPVNTGQAKKQMPKLYAVTPDKADGSILTLEAQGHSPQEAQQYLQGVIQRLLAEDQQRYQQIVGPAKRNWHSCRRSISAYAPPWIPRVAKGGSVRRRLCWCWSGFGAPTRLPRYKPASPGWKTH